MKFEEILSGLRNGETYYTYGYIDEEKLVVSKDKKSNVLWFRWNGRTVADLYDIEDWLLEDTWEKLE